MDKYPVEDLADKIIAASHHVLILDTCCLLDIIRCVKRERLDTLEAAIGIIDAFDKKSNNFDIVLPSLIESEWHDNYKSIRDESKDFIEKYDSFQKLLNNAYSMIFSTVSQPKLMSQYGIENLLCDFSERIMKLALSLSQIESCMHKATFRVINYIPPATRGKDSTKDCLIFEEVLHLCRILRESGYSKKIVFATSNTHEYFIDGHLIPQIVAEISKQQMEIVTSLNHGYHLVKNP